jgi:hypothetical protein
MALLYLLRKSLSRSFAGLLVLFNLDFGETLIFSLAVVLPCLTLLYLF